MFDRSKYGRALSSAKDDDISPVRPLYDRLMLVILEELVMP